MGARVASLVGVPCVAQWELHRDTHLGGMVIARKHGFSNDQWVIQGVNLLLLKYRQAGRFSADPSQMARAPDCGMKGILSSEQAVRALPGGAFDYVWLIDLPPLDPSMTQGLQPVWRKPGSILYRLQP